MARSESYSTRARTEILNYLKQNRSGTVSVRDILQYLQNQGLSVNRTTVYRYLDKLWSDHIILKYADSSCEKAVYQFAGEDGHCAEHLHLKCRKCGKLIHLDCGFMDEFRNHIQQHHSFELQCDGNILYGICDQCRVSDKGVRQPEWCNRGTGQ